MELLLPLVGGLILLTGGGELLVRGAVRLAHRLGISPLVISLTLVGFGTSTPELVTSVDAALSGAPGIAYGNIVGSNIANALLILGVSATLRPILVASRALRRDGMVMVLVSAAFVVIAWLIPMTRLVGAVFLTCLAVYIVAALRQERSSPANHGAAYDKGLAAQEADAAISPAESAKTGPTASIFTAAIGLGLLLAGGHLLVASAVDLARWLNVSETVIGLSIVAVGTSLPELVTSAVAALRKEGDVAFGNLVGSSIYNILGIGGVTALIVPTRVANEIVQFDNWVMIGASLLVVAFALTGRRVNRLEGGALVAAYAAYLTWIWS